MTWLVILLAVIVLGIGLGVLKVLIADDEGEPPCKTCITSHEDRGCVGCEWEGYNGPRNPRPPLFGGAA